MNCWLMMKQTAKSYSTKGMGAFKEYNMVSFNDNHQFDDVLQITQSAEHFLREPIPPLCRVNRLAHIHLKTGRKKIYFYIETELANISDEVFRSVWSAIRGCGLKCGLEGGGRAYWTLKPLTVVEVERLIMAIAVILREAKQQGGNTNEKQEQ